MDSEQLVKSIVQNGAFGSVNYVTSKLEKDVDKGVQFASIVSFLEITVNNGTRDIDYHVVIKKQHISDEAKDLFNSDIAFKNEVIMYKKILPLLKAEKIDLFGKLYQGIQPTDNNTEGNVLIFENLQYDGYMVTKEKLFLDFDHIELALKKLGEFHGLSYIAKQHQKNQFLALANELIETKFTKGVFDEERNMIHMCMLRGIQPLIDENIEVDILNKVVKKLENPLNVVKSLLKPEEPFSVICHGDFCRNNMFFKYDNNDKPISIKFFDLQNSVYSSPAIDLSFFLYMNTTRDMREKYWDRFLKIYWNSLSKSVPILEFTYEQFLQHFAQRAFYGYFPSSFFLPSSMDETPLCIEEFVTLPVEESIQVMLRMAGEKGTKAISDIVQLLLNKHYLEKFLELL